MPNCECLVPWRSGRRSSVFNKLRSKNKEKTVACAVSKEESDDHIIKPEDRGRIIPQEEDGMSSTQVQLVGCENHIPMRSAALQVENHQYIVTPDEDKRSSALQVVLLCEDDQIISKGEDEEEDVVLLLCEDMIQEILLKLPVKTLIRFKQVSKSWKNIITSHNFTWRHYCCYNSISGKPFFVMRQPDWDEIVTTSISITRDPLQCRIHEEDLRLPFGWHSDLYGSIFFYRCAQMCSAGFGLYCIFKLWSLKVAPWNPATREIKELPPSPFPGGGYGDVVGFGHTLYKDDKFSCKVGILDSLLHKHHYSHLHLYSSTTNSWKLLKCDIPYGRPSHPDGVTFKGTLHLLSAPYIVSSTLNRYPCIITFDYATELFGRVELPALSQEFTTRYNIERSRLTLYDDKFLCLLMFWISEPMHGDTKFFDMWVMREYGVSESWSKQGPTVSYSGRVHCSMGEIFLAEYDQGAALGSLWLYNYTSSVVTALPVSCNPRYPFMCILERTESLVSISGTSEETQN